MCKGTGGAAPSSVKQGNVNVAGATNTLCRAVAKGFRSWFKSLALINRSFGFWAAARIPVAAAAAAVAVAAAAAGCEAR